MELAQSELIPSAKQLAQSELVDSTGETAERIAKQTGVSKATVNYPGLKTGACF
jgi:predicted transcriptional regulator